MGVSGVLVQVEVHKRFDPIYVDARDRIKKLGGCSYMCAPTHDMPCLPRRSFALASLAVPRTLDDLDEELMVNGQRTNAAPD